MIPYIVGLAIVGLGASILLEEKKPAKVDETGRPEARTALPFLAAAAEERERNQ